MTLDLTLARATALEAMPDSCRLLRPSAAAPVLDVNTGVVAEPAPTEIWSGPCRVARLATRAATGVAVAEGAQTILVPALRVRLPWDAAMPEPGDLIEVTAVSDAGDPEMVDRTFEVSDASSVSSTLVSRVLTVFERRRRVT